MMKYYSIFCIVLPDYKKRMKSYIYVTTWMNIETLSERRLSQKTTYIIPFI